MKFIDLDSGHPAVIPLDAPHLTVLCLTLILTVIFFMARINPCGRPDKWLRFGLFQMLTAAALAGWLIPWQVGYIAIPLALCDLALFAGIWALWKPDSPWISQLLYFWGLAGGAQALLTPDLGSRFPSADWLQFHAQHAGVVLSACYLAATRRIHPTWRSAFMVWLITNGYAALAAFVNLALETNFGYLSSKPSQPSLLDYFGPWPWYLLAMELIGTLSIVLLTIPLLKHR